MLKVGIGSRARKQKGAIEEVINEVRTFGDTPQQSKKLQQSKKPLHYHGLEQLK